MARIIQAVLGCAVHALLAQAQTCNKVAGGAGSATRSKTSFACVCSGAGGCDTFQAKSYSNSKYAEWVVTDRESNRFAQQETLTWTKTARPSQNDSRLGISTGRFRFQTFKGFGTGLSDSAALNLNSLTPAALDLALNENFDHSKGNNMQFVRTNIGACPHSSHPYTYSEEAGDFDMDNFALTTEDVDLKMPVMEAIQEINPNVEMIGSMWSGPAWMKTTNLEDFGHVMHDDLGYFSALTKYLLSYVDAWTAKGFTFWGISPLNEPATGLLGDVGHPSVQMFPRTFVTWLLSSLSPQFLEKYPDLQIIKNENSRAGSLFYMIYVDAYIQTLDPNNTIPNIWTYGIHWYHSEAPNCWIRPIELGTHSRPLSTESMYKLAPGETAQDFLGNWDNAEEYAYGIIQDLSGNMTIYLDWNMMLDSRGGPSWTGDYASSAMLADASDNDKFYKNPIYYALGHFSRFIEPGWTIVRSDKDHGPGYSHVGVLVAEGGDNDKVAVLQNRNNYTVPVSYFDMDMRKEVQFDLNPDSITTLYYTTQ